MKAKVLLRVIWISLGVVVLTWMSCTPPNFESIDQPESANLNSTFDVDISVERNGYSGVEKILTDIGLQLPAGLMDSVAGREATPYRLIFGINIPIGWTVEDSILFTGVDEGIFNYSDFLSGEMTVQNPPDTGYYWWVSETTQTMDTSTGQIFFTPVITTDSQKGNFFLDYSLGHWEDSSLYLAGSFSYDHMICVGLDDTVYVTSTANEGPGSLRATLDSVNQHGTILFNLAMPDTIHLAEEIPLYKNVTIQGPTIGDLYISGDNLCRIFNIPGGKEVHLANMKIIDGLGLPDGGGIYCSWYSAVNLTNVAIYGNSADNGGGIYLGCQASVIFDSIQRSSIYRNNAQWGNDIYTETPVELLLDTFTVMYPTEYHLFPRNNFTCDILNGKLQQADADLYVSPEGNNSNTGLSASDPLQTIDFAFQIIRADSLHQHIIHLLNGTYNPSSNAERFPVNLPDFIGLSGESENGVIIDAEEQSEAILIDNNAATSLALLTVKRGNMGIYSTSSNLVMNNVTVTYNQNHGIYCAGGLLDLENVKITNNTADSYQDARGGGVQCQGATAIFRNTDISFNTCNSAGGGIYFESVSSMFENVTISHNTAVHGGGISCYYSTFNFNDSSRCNIYHNNAYYGNDLNLWDSYANIVLDTFTVLYPTEFHALGNIDFDILHGKIEQVDCDVYVSPEGNDNNSGLTPEEPLRTIRYAESKMRADAAHHHTIQLLQGTYGPAFNGENMPVNVRSYFSINGTSATDVILDAEGGSGVLEILSQTCTKISNLTVTGGNTINGGGIRCWGNPTIENIIIHHNFATDGAGIYFTPVADGALLLNVLINDNEASNCGGAIFCDECNVTIQNITVSGNECPRGGGLFCMNGAFVIINNSIFSENEGEISFLEFNTESQVVSWNSNYNGWYNPGSGTIHWNGVNIFTDPMFSGSGAHPYALSENSPCIDAGLNSVSNMPEWDLVGNQRIWDGDGDGDSIVDMGAYEFGAVGVGAEEFKVQSSKFKVEIFPNPADRIVDCRFSIFDGRSVVLKIFDQFGRTVRMTEEKVQSYGECRIRIDVSDLPAGLYLVRVQAGKQCAVKKLLVQ